MMRRNLRKRLGTTGAEGRSNEILAVAPDEELLSALLNLGYPRVQAERVVDLALAEAPPESSLEELIRIALRQLAR